MTRRRLVPIAAAIALGAGGCGESSPPSTPLAWEGKPNVFKSHSLPNDRVVVARVRNTGKTTLHLVAADLRIRDAAGHVLKGSAAFTTTFAHGLFGALEQPGKVPEAELVRLGKVIYLPAGASAPFYAAWTLTPDAGEPVHIDYGRGSLTVPQATATTAG